jgi:hypothetical protein
VVSAVLEASGRPVVRQLVPGVYQGSVQSPPALAPESRVIAPLPVSSFASASRRVGRGERSITVVPCEAEEQVVNQQSPATVARGRADGGDEVTGQDANLLLVLSDAQFAPQGSTRSIVRAQELL